MTMDIPTSFAAAVDVAAELVNDGAADTVTLLDVTLARLALANPAELSEPTITAMGAVVALAAEYLVNVADPDDADLTAALYGFNRPCPAGERDAAHCWRTYAESLANPARA